LPDPWVDPRGEHTHSDVLHRRAATIEERLAGRTCVECIRSSWPRKSNRRCDGNSRPGNLRCTLFTNVASSREICDAFKLPELLRERQAE